MAVVHYVINLHLSKLCHYVLRKTLLSSLFEIEHLQHQDEQEQVHNVP